MSDSNFCGWGLPISLGGPPHVRKAGQEIQCIGWGTHLNQLPFSYRHRISSHRLILMLAVGITKKMLQVQGCGSVVTEEQPHAMLIPMEYFLMGYGLYRPSQLSYSPRSPLSPLCISPELLSPESMGVKLKPIKTRIPAEVWGAQIQHLSCDYTGAHASCNANISFANHVNSDMYFLYI